MPPASAPAPKKSRDVGESGSKIRKIVGHKLKKSEVFLTRKEKDGDKEIVKLYNKKSKIIKAKRYT